MNSSFDLNPCHQERNRLDKQYQPCKALKSIHETFYKVKDYRILYIKVSALGFSLKAHNCMLNIYKQNVIYSVIREITAWIFSKHLTSSNALPMFFKFLSQACSRTNTLTFFMAILACQQHETQQNKGHIMCYFTFH